MATTPFFSGKDATLRLFINGNELILNAKSWDCGANMTKVNDGVNGENRDRLQSIINYWEFSCACFMDNGKQIDALLAYYANNDAQVQPLECAAAISEKILDGTRKAYAAKSVTLDEFKLSNSGRTDRVMYNLSFRCQYFDVLPTL